MSAVHETKFFTCMCTILLIFFEGRGAEALTRRKREARQCLDKFAIIGSHSACQPRSSLVQYAGVNQSDIKIILDEHNKYRGSVTPPAANMLKMYWDTEVAEVAQAWAETCSFKHDENWQRNIPGGLSMGQNIGKGYTTWTACIKAWYDEKQYFQYGGQVPFEKVGHFTQLVWDISNKLGCGMANCGTYNFHVCNYGPAGNIGDHNKPYTQGNASCDACSASCKDKLCDCGNKACENEGKLDPGSCSCTCKNPQFQMQPECKLNCSDVQQPYMCGSDSYDKAGCKRYSGSVPSACPLTCNICPYAGYDYKEGSVPLPHSGVNIRVSVVMTTVITAVLAALVFHVY